MHTQNKSTAAGADARRERREMYVAALNAPLLKQLASLKSQHDQAMREGDAYRAGRFEQGISFLSGRLYQV